MKRNRFYALALTLTVLLCGLVACGGNNSTGTEDNKVQTADAEQTATVTDGETEVTENEQVSSVDINPDGLWKFEEAKTPDKGEADKISEDLSKETIYIYGNALYPFTEDGWIKKSTLELIESPAKDSPMDIGPCNKYSVLGSEIAYISDEYLLYKNEDNPSFIVFKKTSNNGQFVLDEEGTENKNSFSEPVSTVTLGEVMYECPSSWKYDDKKTENTVYYWPNGTNDYYYMVSFKEYNGKAAVSEIDDQGNQEGGNGEEYIAAIIDGLNNSLQNFEPSDIEYININGRLCGTISGTWSTETVSYDLTDYIIPIERKGALMAIFGHPVGEEDHYADDVKALLNSLRPIENSQHNLLQMTYDPEKDIQLELINADISEEKAVSQKYVGYNQKYTGDFTFNSLKLEAYYNRGIDTDSIKVRIECTHDGEIKKSEVGTLYPGSVLRFNPVFIEEDETGYWLIKLINDETDKTITGTIIEVINAPEKEVNTTVPEIGMTAEEVEQTSWGKPDRINTTETAYGIHEQWVYEKYGYVYLDDGIVTAIQRSE